MSHWKMRAGMKMSGRESKPNRHFFTLRRDSTDSDYTLKFAEEKREESLLCAGFRAKIKSLQGKSTVVTRPIKKQKRETAN